MKNQLAFLVITGRSRQVSRWESGQSEMGGAIAENYWMDAHEVLASTARRGESLASLDLETA